MGSLNPHILWSRARWKLKPNTPGCFVFYLTGVERVAHLSMECHPDEVPPQIKLRIEPT